MSRQRLDDADITGTELIGHALALFTFIAGISVFGVIIFKKFLKL